MLSRSFKSPALVALCLFVLFSLAIFVMLSTGFGPDRRLRLALGFTVDLEACDPTPSSVRNPAGTTGSWSPGAPLPRDLDEVRAVGSGSRILLGTGIELVRIRDGFRSVGRLYSFAPEGGSYSPLPDPPLRVDHPLLAASGDHLYLVGGFTDGVATAKAWRYSLRERRWTELAPMPTARGALGGAVIGGRLYAVGGSPPTYSDGPHTTLEILDLRTGRWRTGPPMRFARHHVGSAALAGALYVVGGRDKTDYSLEHVERFDPRTGRWETLPPLPLGSGGLAAVTVGSELVAVGGGDDPEGWVTGATWSYDPERSRWRRLPDLLQARHGHGLAAVGTRIYAFGGAPCPGLGSTRTVESLDVR